MPEHNPSVVVVVGVEGSEGAIAAAAMSYQHDAVAILLEEAAGTNLLQHSRIPIMICRP